MSTSTINTPWHRWEDRYLPGELTTITELGIYATNERKFYDQTAQVRSNFAKKHASGVYDHSLAVPFFACTWIPKILESYEREFRTPGWAKDISCQEKEGIAEYCLAHWQDEILENAGKIRAATKYKTLADVRRAHLGYWFTNKVKGSEGFVGGLRRGRFFVTWDTNQIDESKLYKIWGVYACDDGAEIRHLASFTSKELALAEVNNRDPQGVIEKTYSELTPGSERYRNTRI
jgi:hypothetical protein